MTAFPEIAARFARETARDALIYRITRHCSDETAEQMVSGHRTEVLAEVTAWLVKKAREFRAEGTRESRAQADTAAALASQISRGAVRPNNLRMLPAPGFFEAGRTYAHGEYRFACEYLTTRPTSGRISAWGWFGKNETGWRHAAMSHRQYEIRDWTDITEGGSS